MRSEFKQQLKHDPIAEKMAGAAAQTAHWSQAHRRTLLLVGGLVLVLAVAGLLGWRWLISQDAKASDEMAKAMEAYNAPIVPPGTPAQPGEVSFPTANDRARAAHDKFQHIADTYKHTHTADFATYFAATTSLDLGNQAAAEKQFQDLAANATGDLAALSKMALASIYRNTSRDSQAVDLYKQVIDHPTLAVGKSAAQLELASIYEVKDPAEAKKLYQEIAKDNPKTNAGSAAEAKLKAMK